jgi:glycerol-3-phosphate dehydrogenase
LATNDPGSALSPHRRESDLARLASTQFDVLVVGGGITGAGAALDAASRGLSVALLEAHDWAAGTSSRSSKLVHGGLRYLQMLDFRLVHEALRERATLLRRVAPHLVRPLPILYPLKQPVIERAYVGAGVALYDLLALSTSTGGGRGLPWHRHLSRHQALRIAPGLREDALAGAVLYYDCQVDDARYVTEVVRTAASYGAVPVSRASVEGFLREGQRVAGAQVRDAETDRRLEVRARVTVCATGPWTEETEALAGHPRAVRVRPSKGAHLLLHRDRIDAGSGLILRTEKSVLFVLPWGEERWLVGTTDTDWPYSKARPLATAADVRYILAELNSVLRHPVTSEDVLGVYAGLRPLVAGHGVVRGPGEAGEQDTARLSREHAVGRPAPGLVVISGGKFTTYRVMAKDAIDAAVEEGRLHALGCRTARVPLLGARGYEELRARREELAGEHGLPLPTIERLFGRYGALVPQVLAGLVGTPALAAPIDGYLRAEVAYAVSHEGARHLDDVMTRRTRLAIEAPDGGAGVAGEVAAVVGGLLGWDRQTMEVEVEGYRAEAELLARAAREARDDAEAAGMAEQLQAPHVP